MSSIKKHPLYPFFEIGLFDEFRLQDERLEGRFGDWPSMSWIVRISGAGEGFMIFKSEHEAISGCESLLNERPHLASAYLCSAVEDGETELAVRLASRLAYNEGRSIGRREMAVRLGHPELLCLSDAKMLALSDSELLSSSFANGEV